MMLCVTILMSCSGGSPKGTVKKFMKHIESGKYEKAAEYFEIYASSDKSDREWLRREFAKSYAGTDLDKIKKNKFLVKVSGDGRLATVKVKQTTSKGKYLQKTFTLIKLDGKWLISKIENN